MSNSPQQFEIISDGGSLQNGRAAAACILWGPGLKKTKFVAWLGKASSSEAEIVAGFIGHAALESGRRAGLYELSVPVLWHCDHLSVVRQRERCSQHVSAKHDHPLWSEAIWQLVNSTALHCRRDGTFGRLHEQCHEAAAWIERKPRLVAGSDGELLGRNAQLAPEHAWYGTDISAWLVAIRERNAPEAQRLLEVIMNAFARRLTMPIVPSAGSSKK